jgi:hypothetical protein
MQREKWKRVPFDKNYLVSSWGRVFSINREQFLKPEIHSSRANKYLRIKLGANRMMLHVLVALTFKARQYAERYVSGEVMQVNHMDRNTLNCNVNNLEWLTERDNKRHGVDTNFVIYRGNKFNGRKKVRKKQGLQSDGN